MTAENERLTISLPADLAETVTVWWHANRLPSKAAAIRALIEAGLDAQTKITKEVAR